MANKATGGISLNQTQGLNWGANTLWNQPVNQLQVTSSPQQTAKLQVTAPTSTFQNTVSPQVQQPQPAATTTNNTRTTNNTATTGNSTGGSGGGTAAFVADPSELAYWQDQIDLGNESLTRLDRTLGIANSNIDNAEKDALEGTKTQYGRAERDYGTSRQYQIDDQVVTNNNIDNYVRTSNNALQRLFAGAGSGMSSASQIMAPYATAREGTIKRDGADTMYKRNMGKLDTAWQDTTDNYLTTQKNIKKQASDKKQAAKVTYEENRASLLDLIGNASMQKAQAGGQNYLSARAAMQPFSTQASEARGRAVEYGDQWAQPIALDAGNVAFTAPTMDAYNLNRQVVQAPTAMEQLISPSYYPIVSDKEKKNA